MLFRGSRIIDYFSAIFPNLLRVVRKALNLLVLLTFSTLYLEESAKPCSALDTIQSDVRDLVG